MSQLHTYKSYIEYLTAEARKGRLDDLAAGILRTDGQVNELQAEIRDLRRRLTSHIKGESVKSFCADCTKPMWNVDDEDMTCLHCGSKNMPVPDIDAEQVT